MRAGRKMQAAGRSDSSHYSSRKSAANGCIFAPASGTVYGNGMQK